MTSRLRKDEAVAACAMAMGSLGFVIGEQQESSGREGRDPKWQRLQACAGRACFNSLPGRSIGPLDRADGRHSIIAF
jgi:hypothetical protein